jgi:tetratricopeptide (TPR) repeat protein
VANEGIAACRRAIDLVPGAAPAHYYLALNLGQLARTRNLSALGIISEMRRELETARQLDRAYDYAGPDRTLGLLYLGAPGWPLSFGSNRKAREHLQRAVNLSPDYPENRLALLEACLKWDDKKGVASELRSIASLLPQARKTLSGAEWTQAWADWSRRWQAALKKAGVNMPPEP